MASLGDNFCPYGCNCSPQYASALSTDVRPLIPTPSGFSWPIFLRGVVRGGQRERAHTERCLEYGFLTRK